MSSNVWLCKVVVYESELLALSAHAASEPALPPCKDVNALPEFALQQQLTRTLAGVMGLIALLHSCSKLVCSDVGALADCEMQHRLHETVAGP